jgi:hypothetical protein
MMDAHGLSCIRSGAIGLNDQPDPTGAIFWEDISMKTRFFSSVAALALVAGSAHAQDLMFAAR